jgi:preprotein translocase subunit SecE
VAKKESSRDKKKSSNGIAKWFRETSGELRKVSWPTRSETLNLTKIVLIVLVVMSAFLGSLDWLYFNLFKWLLTL